MKRYKVINEYAPVHGLVIETGSVVQLSECRADRGRRFLKEEVVEEKKTKSKKTKTEEDGSNSITT